MKWNMANGHSRGVSLTVFVAAAVGFAALTAPAQANLLTNGSFENTTNFNGCANSFGMCNDNTMSLAVGSTAMPGWTVQTGSVAWIGPNNPFGLTAAAGSYFLDLTDYRDAVPYGAVASVAVATQAGVSYTLTFELGSDPTYGVQDGLTVAVNNATAQSQQFTSTNTGQHNLWQLETFTFVATGASTIITLTGTTGDKYIGLDDVALNITTPLPAALPLFATGLGGLGLLGWRRKRRAA
jgi:hypothetical protein